MSNFVKYNKTFGQCHAVITGFDKEYRLTIFRKKCIVFQADYDGHRWKKLVGFVEQFKQGPIPNSYINLNDPSRNI